MLRGVAGAAAALAACVAIAVMAAPAAAGMAERVVKVGTNPNEPRYDPCANVRDRYKPEFWRDVPPEVGSGIGFVEIYRKDYDDHYFRACYLDAQPYVDRGANRTMVPLRFTVIELGYEVDWDDAARRVTIARAGRSVRFTVGSRVALVNGKETEIEVAPVIWFDRTYVPLRFFAEQLGLTVLWDAEERDVVLFEPGALIGPRYQELFAKTGAPLPPGARLVPR